MTLLQSHQCTVSCRGGRIRPPGEQKRRVQYASIYSTVTTTATSLRFAQPRTNASEATQSTFESEATGYDAFTKPPMHGLV